VSDGTGSAPESVTMLPRYKSRSRQAHVVGMIVRFQEVIRPRSLHAVRASQYRDRDHRFLLAAPRTTSTEELLAGDGRVDAWQLSRWKLRIADSSRQGDIRSISQATRGESVPCSRGKPQPIRSTAWGSGTGRVSDIDYLLEDPRGVLSPRRQLFCRWDLRLTALITIGGGDFFPSELPLAPTKKKKKRICRVRRFKGSTKISIRVGGVVEALEESAGSRCHQERCAR